MSELLVPYEGSLADTPRPQIFEPVLILHPERCKIAPTARIDSFTKIEAAGGVQIGEYVHLASFVHILGGGEVIFGDYSAAASGVKIVSGSNSIEALSASAVAPADMQSIARSFVHIGRFAVLFVNAVVLPGVTVGEGAVVAAGGVLTHDADPWTIYGGIPAKKIGVRHVEYTGNH